MTPNVSSAPNATPAGSSWNLPATRVSGGSSAAPSSMDAVHSGIAATPHDTIEIGETGKNAANAAAGANGPNATTLPSLAVITQRIISEIREEAKTEQKKTDQRRAQDESDLRDAEVRQREQQAAERKQLAQKLDAARRDPAPQPPPPPPQTQSKPAQQQKSDSTPAVPAARPGDPANPTILHAQEIQAQGVKAVSRAAPVSAPDPTTAPAPSAPVVSTPKSVSTVSAPPSPAPPSRDASELLHTITSQLNTSSLYEMSSVHLLSVNFQS